MARQQASKREPVLLRHLPLGNEQETGQTRFRGQQVVAGRIAAALPHIVAYGQQVAGGVVEKFKIHRRQFAATPHQIVDYP